MARRKETIWQRDFSLGAVRPEAYERDDTILIENSLRQARNTITLTPGVVEVRPGTVYDTETTASQGVEVDLGSGRTFDLHITPTGLVLYDADGAVEYTNSSHDWTALSKKFGTYTFADISFWVVPDPDSSSVLIGSRYFPIQALVLDGTWSLGELSFATSLAGAINQPYWRYHAGVTVQPSALTGTITVTASSGIWTDDHQGTTIRYVDREIVLGTRVSATVINATVTEELPPTYDIEVVAVTGFQIGDAVEDAALGGQGIITGISGTTITVLATSLYTEFQAGASNKLVGPNAKSGINTVGAASSPAASYLWDMQLLSPVHGYAGWGARHMNRVYLCDFPGAPQAFAVSQAGAVSDFLMGPDDGDGFVESVGSDRGGELKYIISAEDVLFFTTKGIYYQQTRDGSAVTPKTIGPVSFSRIGCANVRPMAVDDGAVFIDAVGKQVYAAVLAGDIYRSWRARHLTQFHNHLISSPTHIGATASGAEEPEQFIFVTDADGSVAVCQWNRDDNTISWRPWDTDGSFLAIYQVFGKIHAVVDRVIDGSAKRFRERFEDGIQMDCVAAVEVSSTYPEGQSGVDFFGGVTAFATHLEGHTASLYFEGWDLGDASILSSGKPDDGTGEVLHYPDHDGILQVGLHFDMVISPWARRSMNTQRGTRQIKRILALFVTVQDTRSFTIEGRTFGAYRVGEDLTLPPPARSEQYKTVLTRAAHYDLLDIARPRPGPFRMTKIGYRVTI